MLKMKSLLSRFGRRLLLTSGMFALLAVLLAGTPSRPASAASWSFVRIFHASPDAGIVDVFMDGSKILSNFQYGTLTDYLPVAAGSHKLQIAVIGTGVKAAVLSQTLSLQDGVPYTIVALGTQATGFSLQAFVDNNSIIGNVAKVRVYHLSPGTGFVDVNEAGNILITGLSYAHASNYVSISPGSYTFNVTVMPNNTTSSVSAQLKPWTVTSIFAISANSANSKLQFVQAQINGMPGMPGTGSDPRALPTPPPSPSPVSWPWMVIVVAAIGCTSVIITSRRARSKPLSRQG